MTAHTKAYKLHCKNTPLTHLLSQLFDRSFLFSQRLLQRSDFRHGVFINGFHILYQNEKETKHTFHGSAR